MQVSRWRILARGLTLRCPNCGHPDIFTGLRLRATCPLCFMALQRGSGWWLGPLVINYGLVVFALVLPSIGAGLLGWIPLRWGVILALASGLLAPLLLYRWSWSLWLLVYYLVLPRELPANNEAFDLLDHG